MARGLLLGLGVGLLCGWLVFHNAAPERRVAERKTPPISDPKRVRSAPAPAALVPLARDHPTGLSIGRVDGKPTYRMGERTIEARPLADIDRAMQEARAGKNWPEFLVGILQLIVHDSAEADARLVAILRDESLRLPQRIGPRFFEGLENSTVDGIAAAARIRARMEIDEHGDTHSGEGYLSLVAGFGGAADIAWLDTLTERWRLVERALAEGAANPLAARRLKQRFLKERHTMFVFAPWEDFARTNPAVAFDTALAMLPRGRQEHLYFLGAATRADTLERARAALLALEDTHRRLTAISAVERMRRNGLDVSGFAPLLEFPRTMIEEAARIGMAEYFDTAIEAVRSNPVAWTKGNVEALRALAAARQAGASDLARKAYEHIRKGRAETRGWDPERN